MVIIGHSKGKASLPFPAIFFTMRTTMARPKKDAKLLMNIPLRIMLTADQRKLIEQAARTEGVDMTAWARPVLLKAAKQTVASEAELAAAGKRTRNPRTD